MAMPTHNQFTSRGSILAYTKVKRGQKSLQPEYYYRLQWQVMPSGCREGGDLHAQRPNTPPSSPPMAPAGFWESFAAFTALSSLSTDAPALLANFVTGVLTLEMSKLPTVSTTFSSMSRIGWSLMPFNLSTISSISVIACGACDIRAPVKKQRGGGTPNASLILSGAASMNSLICLKQALKASTAPPKMLFKPSRLESGASIPLTSKHFFMESVSVSANELGSVAVSASPSTSFGNFDSFFNEDSSCFMALVIVSANFCMGSVISPAILEMASPSFEASSAKSPSFCATALP
mmetsp:Transcript_60317/g.135863  ORF Transcript_60317/g.135863 Transcript_60317/m.135863 type:complete len:292 (-) Transcript_60317:347-1222(-)